jgi:hypothetical protein
MSMLGKILAVFNVLAALLFIYILMQDYGSQEDWAYTDFRYSLVLTGLPVDSEEVDEDGIPIVSKIRDATAQQLFQSVGGEPKKTLLDEVARVKGKVGEADKDKQAAILGPMARTGAERDALLQKIKEGKGQDILDKVFHNVQLRRLQESADPFTAAFQDVALTEGSKVRDPGEMRESAAHLLFNCAADDKERERVAVVVGIKAYANEVNREADALYSMVQRVRQEMQRDLSDFETTQPTLVKRIQESAERILDAQNQLEKQNELVKSHSTLAMQRETDLKELQRKLAEARDATTNARNLLTKEQQYYFDAEAKVGKLAKENQKLEQELRAKEKVGR